jgi:DNA polymerase-3 subunit delta'
MSWTNILNHESIVDRFRKSVERDRLASTYLFVGPPGIGKRTFALKLAEVMLCEQRPDDFESCGVCPACQQVKAQSHPDLILISKPKDKAFIPLELFIGDKEHRRQEGLCHDIGLKPFRGGRKIAIVDDADFLNQEGANCLLKTLEEPPPNSLLILIGSSEQRQLPTIISRSQVIRFQSLSTEQVGHLIAKSVPEIETEVPVASLAEASAGSVELAMKLADRETFDFRSELFAQLATGDPGQGDFAKTVLAFLDSAGKDAAKKRQRLCLVADFAITFFRDCYVQTIGVDETSCQDECLHGSVSAALDTWKTLDVSEIAGIAIERCIELQWHVNANVSPANAVEAWLIDLGRICRGKSPLAI